MSWYDDLKTRVEQEASNAWTDVQSYLANQARDAVVKVGQEQLGNLSQLDLDKGKAGSAAPVAPASGAPAQNAMQASMVSDGFKKYIPYLLAGTVAYFLFKSKRRG